MMHYKGPFETWRCPSCGSTLAGDVTLLVYKWYNADHCDPLGGYHARDLTKRLRDTMSQDIENQDGIIDDKGTGLDDLTLEELRAYAGHSVVLMGRACGQCGATDSTATAVDVVSGKIQESLSAKQVADGVGLRTIDELAREIIAWARKIRGGSPE